MKCCEQFEEDNLKINESCVNCENELPEDVIVDKSMDAINSSSLIESIIRIVKQSIKKNKFIIVGFIFLLIIVALGLYHFGIYKVSHDDAVTTMPIMDEKDTNTPQTIPENVETKESDIANPEAIPEDVETKESDTANPEAIPEDMETKESDIANPEAIPENVEVIENDSSQLLSENIQINRIIQSAVQGKTGDYSVYVSRIGSDDAVLVNNQSQKSASTIKIFV
ncbi:MAG: hypothetical protein LBN22_02320, partial [Clostridiales Family XIII bacterium]|nr:hypothetical protein [Clostridiales Family XIII bacterium]